MERNSKDNYDDIKLVNNVTKTISLEESFRSETIVQ